LTSYKCSAAKKIIAGIGGKGIKSNALCQDYRMPQTDIYASQIDALFIDSS